MASKQPQRSDLTSDLKCVAQMLYDTNFVLPVWASVRSLRRRRRLRTSINQSEATTASKWPRRSDLTSDLEFVAQTSYATTFVWTV